MGLINPWAICNECIIGFLVQKMIGGGIGNMLSGITGGGTSGSGTCGITISFY
jgi:hypothetical protein